MILFKVMFALPYLPPRASCVVNLGSFFKCCNVIGRKTIETWVKCVLFDSFYGQTCYIVSCTCDVFGNGFNCVRTRIPLPSICFEFIYNNHMYYTIDLHLDS